MEFKPLRLEAVTTHPRHALVEAVREVLNTLGSITSSHAFSNLALTLHFEMYRERLGRLRPALEALPLRLSVESLETLTRLESLDLESLPEELAGSIALTFVHNEPDLRMEIPAVPG